MRATRADAIGVPRRGGARIARGGCAILMILACHVAGSRAVYAATEASTVDLDQLSIEELASVQVSSGRKTSYPLSDAPAAIYVITHNDIVRSGATTIPEILRLAPNLQVAQLSATKYAIGARGFDAYGSNKLLVLIDGRSDFAALLKL